MVPKFFTGVCLCQALQNESPKQSIDLDCNSGQILELPLLGLAGSNIVVQQGTTLLVSSDQEGLILNSLLSSLVQKEH